MFCNYFIVCIDFSMAYITRFNVYAVRSIIETTLLEFKTVRVYFTSNAILNADGSSHTGNEAFVADI